MKEDDFEDLGDEEELIDNNDEGDDFGDEPLDDDGLLDEDFGGDDFDMGGGPSPMEKHNDLLRNLTNFAPFLKDKINVWLGMVWDEEQSKYVRDPHLRPIMNTQCAKWCIDYLQTYARGNNIITHINKEDYIDLHEDIIEVVWENLGTRPEEFGLISEGDLKAVAVELEHAAILVLMGAGDGKYGGLLKETVNRSENVSYNAPYGDRQAPQMMPPQKPDGFFGRMGKALKGGK